MKAPAFRREDGRRDEVLTDGCCDYVCCGGFGGILDDCECGFSVGIDTADLDSRGYG